VAAGATQTRTSETAGPALDRPLYTISVAAEILGTHPRTLMMYENLGVLVPNRTASNRRRYSQRNLLTVQALRKLTRGHGLNIAAARYVIRLLQILDSRGIARPPYLEDVVVTHVRI
jgi:DNA-binding transcriptional MerR regulator